MNPKAVQQSLPIIDPNEIEQLRAMSEALKALKERTDLMESAVKRSEAKLIDALDAGAISPPNCALSVVESARRYPKWKEHFVDYAGKAEADAVLNETPPTITRKLVIK